MHTSPRQESCLPIRSGDQRRIANPQSSHAMTSGPNAHGQYLDSDLVGAYNSGPLQPDFDAFDEPYGSANAMSQYQHFDLQRSHGTNRHNSFSASSITSQNDQDLIRGISNYDLADLGTQGWGLDATDHVNSRSAPSSYSVPQRSIFLPGTSPPLLSMQHLLIPTIEHTAPLSGAAVGHQTKYEPFQNLFHTSDEARDHRRRGTRFDRLPYFDPNTDASIAEIERDREKHVMRIYNAMTSGESAKDNRGSIAMKRWVLDAHYPPDLVEAYSHKVFDCLLAQAKEGFRGWVHNDYVADERKGDDIDKDVDCAGRLNNIIAALEREKTICEDVMNSACQIRMFVNAPRAYANRKHQNRVGNSKRGRTKDTPDSSTKGARPSRARATRGRTRSTVVSDFPNSRESTPQQQLPLPHPQFNSPYYSSPNTQYSSSSPAAPGFSRQQFSPVQQPARIVPQRSFGQQPIPNMVPPSSHLSQAAPSFLSRMATSPQHQDSFLASSPRSHGTFSTPASPDDAKHTMDATIGDWIQHSDLGATSFGPGPALIDPILSTSTMPYREPVEGSGGPSTLPTGSDEFVALSDIEGLQRDGAAGGSTFGTTDDWWMTAFEGEGPSSANPHEGHF
jgi:hypothetical protein